MRVTRYDQDGNILEDTIWYVHSLKCDNFNHDYVYLPKDISKEKENEILIKYSLTSIGFLIKPTPIIEYYEEPLLRLEYHVENKD